MKINKKIGSFVVLTRNDKKEVFLVKRSDFPVWEPQGGGIEKDETPEDTADREAYEETGFKIKILRKVAEYTNTKNNKTTIHVFEGRYISGTFKEEYKGCEGNWYKIDNLPLQIAAIKKEMIKDVLLNNNKLIVKNEIPLVSIQNIHLLLLLPLQSIKYILIKLFLAV